MPEPIIPPPVTPPVTPPAPAFLEQIPETFRDKPWAKENAKDAETFFKFVDNQNSLVGKKGIIVPGEGATPEQMNEYYKSLGRPDTFDGYEFTPIPELKDQKRDPEIEKATKELMHKIGVPKSMAAQLQQGYEKMMYDRSKVALDAQKAEDAAFEKFNTEFFGAEKDKVVANAQKILRATLPKEVLPALDKMNSEQLAMVIAVTDSVYKKFGKEDGFKGGAPGASGTTGTTYEELSAQQRALMGQEGFDDWRHANHASLMAQNQAIMEKMRALKK